ncbi:proteasome assembly chaperone 4 [Indicator indicator]|uniref:proteasome assembly chaperone 4 n=1 Tax=Indicator indicator TaxID=1002788 RepID=UPI0023DEEA03|nr:proteasome assembly chaperone 4 [Indicator indicator]
MDRDEYASPRAGVSPVEAAVCTGKRLHPRTTGRGVTGAGAAGRGGAEIRLPGQRGERTARCGPWLLRAWPQREERPMEEAAAGDGAAAGSGAAAGGIALHDFSGRLGEQRVHFHAMRLQDSLFLWVGAAPALASLAVAMCSPRDSIPVAASLLGDPSDTASACLARRLASKTKKQIFVSYNLQNTDSSFTLLIENRIKEEMMAFPEKF